MTTLTSPRAPHTEVSVDRRQGTTLALAAVAGGLVLAVIWSYEFVDGTIGDNVANGVLGYDAKETAIAGTLAGALFGLVSGLAGTFTACNIAVFSVLPDVTRSNRERGRAVLASLGWLSAGVLAVAAVYGFVAVLLGPALPQLSTARIGVGLPVRLVQASVVFGLIGLAFCYLGLAALGRVPDPFARHPRARLFVLGGLIGGFLVGRPYPLFHKLLAYAVDQRNPLYGSATFILQALGNILVMAVLAVLLVAFARGRFGQWLANPAHAAATAGFALLLLGTFLVVYWDVRLPAMFGYGWFPVAPWNT